MSLIYLFSFFLRCDRRVFECAPLLEILLYILKACLAASRTMLTQHLQENPIIERSSSSQVTNDLEREELKNALTTAQESAAVQILLEAGLSQADSHVREVKLICSYLHETFINDPNLAKLVHFQVTLLLHHINLVHTKGWCIFCIEGTFF